MQEYIHSSFVARMLLMQFQLHYQQSVFQVFYTLLAVQVQKND